MKASLFVARTLALVVLLGTAGAERPADNGDSITSNILAKDSTDTGAGAADTVGSRSDAQADVQPHVQAGGGAALDAPETACVTIPKAEPGTASVECCIPDDSKTYTGKILDTSTMIITMEVGFVAKTVEGDNCGCTVEVKCVGGRCGGSSTYKAMAAGIAKPLNNACQPQAIAVDNF